MMCECKGMYKNVNVDGVGEVSYLTHTHPTNLHSLYGYTHKNSHEFTGIYVKFVVF